MSHGVVALPILQESAFNVLPCKPTHARLPQFGHFQHADMMVRRQRYSHYLPLKRQSRNTSRATSLIKERTRSPRGEKEKDTKEPKEPRNGRNSSATHSASKRRSTMNSREAAYDEAEAIRRAIEASKEDAQPDQPDGSVRRAKRGRSDSEE